MTCKPYSNYDIDELNQTLVYACRNDKSTVRIKNLINAGANVNCEVYVSECGVNMTPLKAACGHIKSFAVVKCLLDNGADPNYIGEWSRATVISKACNLGGTNYKPVLPKKKVIDLLVNSGAKISSDDISDLQWIYDELKAFKIKSNNYDRDINYIKSIIDAYNENND